MYRRVTHKLPPDVTFPADLQALGYFVTEKDQIRQIRDPEKKYQYKINRNDRVNDVYKEAMNTCSRAIVRQRLLDLGLQELAVPLGATPQDKHVSILISPDLASKKHILVIFTERHIDLGILSYRILGDEGINHGSIVNFVKTVLKGPTPPAGRPGLIITNPSQLIWYRGGSRAVTDREWSNLPRASPVINAMRIDPIKNRIDGNKNFEEHVQYIFENILTAPATNEDQPNRSPQPLCNPSAKLSIIGLEYPGSTALQYLVHNWPHWSPRLSCIALCNPQHTLRELFSQFPDTPTHATVKTEITKFIATRTRAYRVSRRPVETPLQGIDTENERGLGCNVYSSGEALYEESVFVRCWGSILDWIDLCRFSEGFEEPVFVIPEEDEGEGSVGEEGKAGDDDVDVGWNGGGNGDRDIKKKVIDMAVKVKFPRTEEEIEKARFHGEIEVAEGVADEDCVDRNGDGHDDDHGATVDGSNVNGLEKEKLL